MTCTIILAHQPPWLDPARRIFAEYAVSIAHIAGCSLQHQRFDAELANLPGLYAPPRGGMLLAIDPDAPLSAAPTLTRARDEAAEPLHDGPSPPPDPSILGCIALRPLPALGPGVCEMKRMYVRPHARRRGIAHALATRLLADARAAGYRLMKLDTSDTMLPAIALYQALGFAPCPRYNDDPMTDTLWFEKPL